MQKLQHFIRTHTRDIFLLGLSLIGVCTAYLVQTFIANQEPVVIQAEVSNNEEPTPTSHDMTKRIRVDVSGAVINPGVYSLVEGDRVSDAIDAAHGLSNSADVDFYARNYNAARVLSDEEKIYIPRIDEVDNRIFIEGQYIIDHSLLAASEEQITDGESLNSISAESGVNINTATSTELESLNGIGPVTAQKIIESRPYENVNDLVEKKIIGESVFEKIKSDISL